ncbi:MAG: UDP-glucose/GDP-mannose dehydrogenase family protein [Wenzhouxiangellaceae bacterium]|nr:UDP-glucose/GDP-mannose dehydrogenase family protein [Wenzhouxiangellaceae bacterium]MBS3746866.1 UDP-glucose/GDP-mannose dehydrogenase family protein [Wenzhouxiangellaceae bacterium]MBS3824374.1 UDP-glucose/GDP-mannose dehydrogenase family protein [Wenzhouxiangellaceae bacterium]
MRISIFGTGYVGLVTGACLAEVGNDVVCMDIDQDKVDALNRGEIPIFEPGLEGLVQRNAETGRLRFSSDAAETIRHGEILFIAVGTPSDMDGSADLRAVLSVARTIGRELTESQLVVTKSTVPVGTAEKVRASIIETMAETGASRFTPRVASNPEFLKEGAAVKDFMAPDRIVIGVDDPQSESQLRRLYAPFNRNREKIFSMDIASAELTKYAANAMLATKISFMNELANIAERVGADIERVRIGIGSDPRIGYHFIYPGVGYGGSCFPKDIRALARTAADHDHQARILQAVETVNQKQKLRLFEKVSLHFGNDLAGRTIALWGLAFKPETDDMREAPALVLMEALWEAGAKVRAFDPKAMPETRRICGEREDLTLVAEPYAALEGADALVVVTEWKAFWSPDFERIKSLLSEPVIFDGRNIYDPQDLALLGFRHEGIGRRATLPETAAEKSGIAASGH